VELHHTFTVQASVPDTWATFQDIESVAGCFPGATVTEVSGDDFKGSCKVKLGPIALVYSGSGTFLEKDESAHRFVIEAKGKDKRGNGTAGATVTATFAEEGPDATTVDVVTDLAITGKPAQFGRGVIEDVSNKLLQQFVTCLQSKVGAAEPETPDVSGAPDTAATDAPSGTSAVGGDVASGAAITQTETSGPAATDAPPVPSGDGTGSGARKAPSSTYAGVSAGGSAGDSSAREDDALDLGATVLPILLRTYWKQGLGALGVLAVILMVLRRRR
jgi:uncharacterized protein